MKSFGFKQLFIILLLIPLVGCETLFGPEEDKTKGWSASKFYKTASENLAEGDYETAIKYYELLEARYPFGKYAMQAQLDVAYAYYKDGESDAAIAAAERFIRTNPSNPHVDYAYYLKGLANFNRNVDILTRFLPTDQSQRDSAAAVESFKDFATLVRQYPNSPYAADARQRLIYLRNLVAQQEVHVAEYYIRRGAYLAAANRCKAVVENYPGTPAVEQALEIMIDAYNRLDQKDLAADTQRVLAYNREKGNFQKVAEPGKPSLTKVVWDYLQLDKN